MAYSPSFLEGHIVDVPLIDAVEQEKFSLKALPLEAYYLDYNHYSLLQSPFRKFPYYTAANIDGGLFKSIKRETLFSGNDTWKKDSRIPEEHQLGEELYGAADSNFDKGHLTKREDVQWGKNEKAAKKAAISTFCYTNAAPQVDRLNRGVWRRIEDYILHHEVVKQFLKISLMTGPLLLDTDPDFVTDIGEETIQLPTLFYKVVYYIREGELYRTGFLTSQKGLLRQRSIIKPLFRGETLESHDLFHGFKDAQTYQVRVSFIEGLGNLKFQEANELFVENTPEELILDEIDVQSKVLETTRSRSRTRSPLRTNLVL
ncbi:DNA/RNA non-specific endonuclease [uncultured Dokdonia sp.]|uniref:DNA/RNA non-specific endonuclease n=1 Tax=uncultured Dokdonia sp. TaxID=575653 RepID=UPI0026317D74|nr:DNA/RNA non-specific endonuclease [uncultured Dokdonia sp.]